MFQAISLFLLFTSISQIWAFKSFADFPLTIADGDYMVHVTLTDLTSYKKYYLQEYIHASESTVINGKISISSSDLKSPIDIHYGSSSENQRLVVQDYDCNLFTYKTKWDQKITGITNSLVNHILLVGPSLIYRLAHKSITWRDGYDANIRGTIMKSAYASIGGDTLKMTVYYKKGANNNIDLTEISRIQFSGKDPSDYSFSTNQDLILDYYLHTRTDEELDKVVIPKLGIGCPIFFVSDVSSDKIFLSLVYNSVHFIATENVNGPTKSSTRNEIFANEANQLLSLKTTSQGVTTEAIYDYILRLIYVKNDGGCLVSPMALNSFGIEADDPYKPLEVNNLIQPAFNPRYLGQTWFENRPGFVVDVWEAIAYNGTTSSGQYDKVVTTIFTVDSKNADTRSGMIPVGKTVHAYKESSTGSYSLVETTTTDYYDFSQEITITDYEDRFRISDCYPKDRKTLAIYAGCKGQSCNYELIKYPYSIGNDVRQEIAYSRTISSSRIGNIDIVLDSNSFIAYVTFLGFPLLTFGFKTSYLYLSPDVFKNVQSNTAQSSSDCLKQNANMKTTFEAVAYCDKGKTCSRINKISDLVADQTKGIGCSVFYIPFKNLNEYNRQTPLEKIQDELKRNRLIFSFIDQQSNNYQVSRIDEVTEPESKPRQLFVIQDYAWKLVEDGSNTLIATETKNLGDCYRACANFNENDCETFSFCQHADKVECLLSTSIYANVTDKRTYDSDCEIYRKNRLNDYIRIQNREFKNPISITSDIWIDDCADLCSQSDECFSFQISHGTCQFGGYYTDSSTKFSQDSDIYIPKLAHKYALTGTKIVTETFHTELSLTLDQCAALCYDMETSDGVCLSYNFCPKGKTVSSCSLSKYSVKDSATKTSDSNVCTNYELKPEISNNKKQKEKSDVSIVNGTSGAGAFGIIILFVGVGLVIGSVGPFVYRKSRSFITNLTSSETDTFNWNRQLDEDTEQDQSAI